MCQGYYRHDKGYTPGWDGMETFEGRIVHPQSWPENLDCADKTVVVIGSGATAATLIPAIAGRCRHVTMLQRSPTYYITGRNANVLADTLRELDVKEEWIHEITRRKVLYDQAAFTRRCFSEPEAVKQELLSAVRAYLGEDYDVETHFTPKYRPWRQRIAFIPDGDLFREIRSERASVVTDEIERFTPAGILTKSGKLLEADIVVTATGFNLNVLGDIAFAIDERPLDFSGTVTYRGMMFVGVPNMAWVFGYFRSSWTLRADLVGDFVCRLLNHMKEKRRQGGDPEPPPRRQGHAPVSLGGSRGVQSRLSHARHAFVAETGGQAGVATLSRLLGRQGCAGRRRPRRSGARLRMIERLALAANPFTAIIPLVSFRRGSSYKIGRIVPGWRPKEAQISMENTAAPESVGAVSPDPTTAEGRGAIDAARRSVEDAAPIFLGLWLSYLGASAYLVITVAAVTHKDLFLGSTVKLPLLSDTPLPIVGFFVLAPISFVILHAYILVHFRMLAAKIRVLESVERRYGAKEFSGMAAPGEHFCPAYRQASGIYPS